MLHIICIALSVFLIIYAETVPIDMVWNLYAGEYGEFEYIYYSSIGYGIVTYLFLIIVIIVGGLYQFSFMQNASFKKQKLLGGLTYLICGFYAIVFSFATFMEEITDSSVLIMVAIFSAVIMVLGILLITTKKREV